MHQRIGMLLVAGLLPVMGAQCQPSGPATPIPAGTYRGTIAGQSELFDQNNTLLQSGATQSTITLVVDAAGKPISMNIEGAANAPSQTLTKFAVGESQRFQYSYNDSQNNGQVNVDYTAQVTRSEQTTAAYVVEYTFTGSQTTAFGVTSMFGRNEYQLYNQALGVWVIHNQTSTLTPPGGQGLLKTTLFETGILPKAN